MILTVTSSFVFRMKVKCMVSSPQTYDHVMHQATPLSFVLCVCVCVCVCVCWCEGTLLPLVAEVARVSFMKPHHSPDVEHELSRCLTKARVSVPPLPSSPPPPPLQLLPVRLLSLSRQDPWSGGHLLHIHTPTTRTPDPETRLPAVRWSSSPGARRRVPRDTAARLQSVMVSRTADSDPLMRRGARRRWSRPRTAALQRTRESNPQSGTLYLNTGQEYRNGHMENVRQEAA